MGISTTYLIVQAFSVIPFFAVIPFAFWPILVVPMAVIAGAAYGLLIYNTITDLINNNTFKRYLKIITDLRDPTKRNVLVALGALVLIGLAITLTVCTAGTWWTIANNALPLFEWMSKMPSFIMGIINPIIIFFSTSAFNIPNTMETLKMLQKMTFTNPFLKIKEAFDQLHETENWWQIFNPFRIILKLTITPLRILLFLGHLISIALTADRMPGIPEIASILIAIICEGFEDAHWFVGHEHEHEHEHEHHHEHHEEGDHHHHDHDAKKTKHLLKDHLSTAEGHNHDADIPTWFLIRLAYPLYALAAGWDYLFSQKNSLDENKISTFKQAWNKQRGIPEKEKVNLPADEAQHPSEAWHREHAMALIEEHEAQHPADKEKGTFKQLKTNLRTSPTNGTSTAEILATAADRNRLFAEKPCPQPFVEKLNKRVNLMAR